MPSTRHRIRPYVDDDIYALLRTAAQRSDVTESSIVNTALADHFRGEHASNRFNAMLRRMDQISRAVDRNRRDQMVHSEAFALFVRYFLTVIPPVGSKDKEAAQAQGQSRFETYLDSLKTILADGDPILLRALDEVKSNATSGFTAEEIARLHEPRPETETAHA